MATIEQITKDPRFGALPPEKKKLILSMAENAPSEFSRIVPEVAKKAISEAMMQKGTLTRDLMTDPETQAKALPELAGTVAAGAGIPMGATMGAVGGRQLSNLALKTYGKEDQIPSAGMQALEAAGSVLGDVTAIPAINRARFGRQVGMAEKMAGVPPVEDISSTPMALGQKTLGEYVNDAVESVKSSRGQGTASYWKQIKDQVDRIYDLGKDQALTTLDQGRLKWLNTMVQNGLNKAVPGREEAAKALASSQVVPNAIMKTYRKIPGAVKAGGVGGVAFELGRRLINKNGQ